MTRPFAHIVAASRVASANARAGSVVDRAAIVTRDGCRAAESRIAGDQRDQDNRTPHTSHPIVRQELELVRSA
jgi:hypothetical protein